MDWTLALKLNQEVLLRNVAWLFTWLKLEVGGAVESLPRHKWLMVLFVLRPAESAFRRLVLVAVLVHGVSAPLALERAAQSQRSQRKSGAAKRQRNAALPFKLTDQRKPFDLFPDKPKFVQGPGPRVTDMWSDDPVFDRSDLYAWQERQNREPEEDISATSLCNRMNALMAGLQDLDAQAVRMAKLLARIKQQKPKVGKFPLRVMRPGLPPGYRQRQKHEVDEVLAECHRLALSAQRDFGPPDTS